MDRKKESPNNQAGRTGNGNTHKDKQKRNRINRAILVTKWIPPVEVLELEGGPR